MLFNHKMKAATVLLISTLIAGCAGALSGGVKEENRDTEGTYDGVWTVEVQKAAGTQLKGNWRLNCGDMRRTFNIRVNDGAMTLSDAADAKKAFVSKGGAFKLILPLNRDASASGTSATTLANGDRQLILAGTLAPDSDSSKGYITYGIAQFGYGGCTAKTKYNLANPLNKS